MHTLPLCSHFSLLALTPFLFYKGKGFAVVLFFFYFTDGFGISGVHHWIKLWEVVPLFSFFFFFSLSFFYCWLHICWTTSFLSICFSFWYCWILNFMDGVSLYLESFISTLFYPPFGCWERIEWLNTIQSFVISVCVGLFLVHRLKCKRCWKLYESKYHSGLCVSYLGSWSLLVVGLKELWTCPFPEFVF